MAIEKAKQPLCNSWKKKPKTIDNDVKEKHMTSPRRPAGKKAGKLLILRQLGEKSPKRQKKISPRTLRRKI